MKKPVPGDVIRIEFLDHCQVQGHDGNVIECSLVGQLLGETDNSYEVGTWMVASHEDVDNNDEIYHIVKAAVTSIKVCK